VVAGGPAGSCASSAGKIMLNGDLYYAGASSIAATSPGSFAALACNCLRFDKFGGDMTAVGIYFVQQGTQMQAYGSTGRRFLLYGVRTQGIAVRGFRPVISYDPNLRAYPPPGLPERALLVNWISR